MSEEPVGGPEAEELAAEAERARKIQETGQPQASRQMQVFDPKEIFPSENELSPAQRRRFKSLEPELQQLWQQMNEQARQTYRQSGNVVAALQALPAQVEFAELNDFILKGKPLSERVKQLAPRISRVGAAAGAVGSQLQRGVARATQERAAAFAQYGETAAEKARVQKGQEGFSTVTYQGRGPTAPKTPSGSFGGESPFGAQVEHERHESTFDQEHGLVGVVTGDVDADKLPEDFIHGNDIHQEPPREDRGESWELNDNFDIWTGTYKDGSRKPHQKGYNVISGTSNDQVVIGGEKPRPVGDVVLGEFNGPESPAKEKSIFDSIEPNPEIEGSTETWEVNDDYDILTGTHKRHKKKPASPVPAVVPNEEGELVPTVKKDYDLVKGSREERVREALQKIEEEESGTAKEMNEPKSDATGGYTPDLQELREAVGGRTELKFYRIIGRERGNGPHAGEGKYLVTTVPVDPKFMKIEWRPYGSQSAIKRLRKSLTPQAQTATENALKRAAQTTAAPTNEEVLEGSNTLGGEQEHESSVFDDVSKIKEQQDKSGKFLSGIL